MQRIELSPPRHPQVPYSPGFCLLARKQQLKLDLDAGGPPLMEDLIDSLIASGFNTEDEIIGEIGDITGSHSEEAVRVMLMELENLHWLREADGTYTLRQHH